jgi:hypothetical protein
MIAPAVAQQTLREFGFDEALRNITDQAGVLEALRGRAGTALAAASLVTGFLGGLALASPTLASGVVSRPPIGVWGWLAISSFCAVGLMSLVILFPYRWRFTMDPTTIVTSAENDNVSLDEVKWDLTGYHWVNYQSNQKKLDRLYWAFRFALLGLLLETIFWILETSG